MDAQPSEPTSWLIQFGIAAIGAAALVLAKFIQGLRSPEKIEHKILTAEIADTSAVAAKIVADLTPPIREILSGVSAREAKQAEMSKDIKRILELLERSEIRREERERVEREHWTRPAE